MMTLGQFDQITLAQLSDLELFLEEGSILQLVGSSILGGELDTVLATGNPYDGSAVLVQPVLGELTAFLQTWSAAGPGYTTLAEVTVTAVPEPSALTLLLLGTLGPLGYALRRRKRPA